MSNDRFHPFMAAGTALTAQSDLTRFDIYVVNQYDNFFRWYFKEFTGFSYALAAIIHKGEGLKQYDPLSLDDSFSGQAMEAQTARFNIVSLSDHVQRHIAKIVPAFLVLGSGITQTCYQPAI